MESLLYSFFVQSNVNSLVSFQRIKRFLSNIQFDNEINKNRLESLYKLLNIGVIDYAGNDKYYMSPSIIINAKNFKIGINLPIDVIETNKDKIINQNTGVTIFNSEVIVLNGWDIMNVDYKYDNYISNFIDVYKIPLNWNSSDFPTNFIKIEIFDNILLNWKKTECTLNVDSLYKVYISSNDYFENYYFYYNQIWYKLKFEEYEKVKLAKMILATKNKLEFNNSKNILSIPNNFPLPSFIEKNLFINHCLTKGEFPVNRKYFIDKVEFKKMNKIVLKNHIKIVSNE